MEEQGFLNHFPLGLVLLCSLAVFLAKPATTSSSITHDQSALLALKVSGQILAKNWSARSSVCDWIGVTCSGARGRNPRVSAFNISNMNLASTLPPQLGNISHLVSLNMSRNAFHGEIPVELAQLRRLRVLDLGTNNLTGHLPQWLASFHQLQVLNLGDNSFTGLIPPSITNMSNLRILDISFNSLLGNIPTPIFNISSMEVIYLGENTLSGSIPANMCYHLPRLRVLALWDNHLSGPVPSSLGQCSELQRLSLSYNKFTGNIPKGIGNLGKLELLYLGSNHLHGEIPKEIGNLTMLNNINIDSNNITGVIPAEIRNLHNIKEIKFGWNKLTGTVPEEIFNLSTVTLIDLGGNQLSGNLPLTMGYGLPSLQKLYLTTNTLVGAIPNSISNCSKLTLLELSLNNFTGPIPNSLGDLRLLRNLRLHDNRLTGSSSSSSQYTELRFITSLTSCKHLAYLGLSSNPLNGVLPGSVGNLSASLEMLHLFNGNIGGNIPNGIGNLSNLVVLSLSDNPFTGSLPSTIKGLRNLQEIYLTRNKISVGLQSFCSCQSLGKLVIQHNHIVGRIPVCLGNLTSMRYLYLNSNGLNSTLPKTLWTLKDLLILNVSSNLLSGFIPPEIKNLKMAIAIDLSKNQFTGGIPVTIVEMQDLYNLSLAHNRLEGSIPESVGKMLSLVRLDLSQNFLSGSLPVSLETLQYLRFFNVSFNNLTGEIPSGGPFIKLNGECFISNEGLCGAQRFNVPQCPSISDHSPRTKKVRRIIIIVISTVSVVVLAAIGISFKFACWKKQKVSSSEADTELVLQERITYYKLIQATNGYNQGNLLGVGSFGSVYKGILDDGRCVAVKVFNSQTERSFKSFDAECKVLSNLRHRNITRVISSCSNPDFKALVLEYMPNGNLDKWLYSNNEFLNIIQRLDILIDVASALQYLHYDNSIPMVHCDLKPSNVLLDEDMVGHVSDFGIAKMLNQENSVTYTETLATLCYLAPEYGLEGLVSTKCDVYSFGIMMMEVFTRMSPRNQMFGENMNLKSWVKNAMDNGILARVVDANWMRASDDNFPGILAIVSSLMEVALNCTKESPRERCNIADVVATLNKIKLQLMPYMEYIEGIQLQ